MSDEAAASPHHVRTAWHALLVVILDNLLPKDWWRLTPEYQLTREPLRIDAIIVRLVHARGAPPAPTYLRSVLDELLAHNVIHFKGPTDELEVADVFQVIAYAAQYMNLEGLTDPATVSIRVVAAKLTPRFRTQLARMGGALVETELRGVHTGHLGVFSLRVVETSVAYPHEHEHLLYAFSPDFVAHPANVLALDDRERYLYYLLWQSIAQAHARPNWKATMKDASLVEKTFKEAERNFVNHFTPEEIAEYLRPEQLTKLTPEQRLAGLAPEHVVLALPDDALRALSDDYVATLPADVQTVVRARRGR